MASVSFWTTADSFVIVFVDTTFSVYTAGTDARVFALESNTSQVWRTFRVSGTLRITSCVGISQVVFWTTAHSTVISDLVSK